MNSRAAWLALLDFVSETKKINKKIQGEAMDDYCNGIAYATGYFAKENGKMYSTVRNFMLSRINIKSE